MTTLYTYPQFCENVCVTAPQEVLDQMVALHGFTPEQLQNEIDSIRRFEYVRYLQQWKSETPELPPDKYMRLTRIYVFAVNPTDQEVDTLLDELDRVWEAMDGEERITSHQQCRDLMKEIEDVPVLEPSKG